MRAPASQLLTSHAQKAGCAELRDYAFPLRAHVRGLQPFARGLQDLLASRLALLGVALGLPALAAVAPVGLAADFVVAAGLFAGFAAVVDSVVVAVGSYL